jgi:hypothetical protein
MEFSHIPSSTQNDFFFIKTTLGHPLRKYSKVKELKIFEGSPNLLIDHACIPSYKNIKISKTYSKYSVALGLNHSLRSNIAALIFAYIL